MKYINKLCWASTMKLFLLFYGLFWKKILKFNMYLRLHSLCKMQKSKRCSRFVTGTLPRQYLQQSFDLNCRSGNAILLDSNDSAASLSVYLSVEGRCTVKTKHWTRLIVYGSVILKKKKKGFLPIHIIKTKLTLSTH